MTEPKSPKGVVAVLIGPQGDTFASASDFAPDCYGGLSLEEAQTYRAKRQLAFAAVRAMCSDWIVKAIDDYDCEKIMHGLERKCGFKVSTFPVGHGKPKE